MLEASDGRSLVSREESDDDDEHEHEHEHEHEPSTSTSASASASGCLPPKSSTSEEGKNPRQF
jgi:hypothetical protein